MATTIGVDVLQMTHPYAMSWAFPPLESPHHSPGSPGSLEAPVPVPAILLGKKLPPASQLANGSHDPRIGWNWKELDRLVMFGR